MPQGTIGDELRAIRAKGVGRGMTPAAAQARQEQPIPEPESGMNAGTRGLVDLGIGGAKGAGESAFNLGKLVHNTPVLGDITDFLGESLADAIFGKGTNADAAFAQVPQELEAKGSMQGLGKGVEQFAEFFALPGPARASIIKSLVSRIPNNASPAVVAKLNKLAAVLGRSAGEAGSAAGVSELHGSENTGKAAAVAGAVPFLGSATSGAAGLLTTKLGKQIAPIGAASLGMGMLPGIGGLGASMGLYSLMKRPIQKVLESPQAARTLRKAGPLRRTLRKGGETIGRGAAAGLGQAPSRRQLPPPEY